MVELPKLNLGSGKNPLPGYINVDKFGSPDVLHDLEVFPWPWETSSIGEIRLTHVLEHLGQTPDLYFRIVKELYRVCAPDAMIYIRVPHPRSDDFLSDPTHVRPVTAAGFMLFSKAQNRLWIANQNSNSPLALYLDVDFEQVSANYVLNEPWRTRLQQKEITFDEALAAVDQYCNVVKEIEIDLKVIKTAQDAGDAVREDSAGAPANG